MVIMAISGIEMLHYKVPNWLGVTSASKSDCQRLSRVLLLPGIKRKQSKLPFESLTMVRFKQENGCNNPKFGLQLTEKYP